MATPPPTKKQRAQPPPIRNRVQSNRLAAAEDSDDEEVFGSTVPRLENVAIFAPPPDVPEPHSAPVKALPKFTTQILPKSGNLTLYKPVARKP
jgi:hypothetical protein